MKITEQQLRQVIKEEIEIEIDAQVTADDFIQISRRLNKLYRRLDDMDQQDEVMEIHRRISGTISEKTTNRVAEVFEGRFGWNLLPCY